jgi:hypothetical protein
MHGMTIGGEKIADYATTLLDTGNTLISMPLAYKSRVFTGLKNKGLECEAYQEANKDFYQVGCKVKKLEDIPDMTVDLNGVIFQIAGTDLIDSCQSTGILFGGYQCLLTLEF